jgi:hypothetical protein
MNSNIAISRVGVAGMPCTLQIAEAAAAAVAAHPAFLEYAAGAAAAIPAQRTRRTATATGMSVNRGHN